MFRSFLLATGALGVAAAAAAKPNIVWIMADDLGWGEPSAYPAGSKHGRISTPHLDAFAASGIRFTDAYAGYTVCAPSRTTLMTGFHSGHFGAKKLPGTSLPTSVDILTTPEMLQKAGYATAGVGKMAPLNAPVMQGFDYFIGQINQGLCHNMYPQAVDSGNTSGLNVNLTLNFKVPADAKAARTACMADPSAYNYTVDITHEHSMAWIKNQGGKVRDAAKPFFLYEAFTVPHAGGWGHAPSTPESGAPVPSDGMYAKQAAWPDVEKDHAAVITYLDNYVGKLVALLKSEQIEKNTIVFFASDNGAHLEGGHDYHFFNSTGGLLGHKRSLYEGGMRSPIMVSWPGTITPAVSHYAWAFWDFMPTVAELSGGTAGPGIDGVSIVPTLMGKTQPPKEYLYWTWDGTGCGNRSPNNPQGTCSAGPDAAASSTPSAWVSEEQGNKLARRNTQTGEAIVEKSGKGSGYGMRVGDWKVVVAKCANNQTNRPSKADVMEIYHLPSDPFEAKNVNATAAGVAQAKVFLTIAKKHDVSCHCFQC